MTGSARIFRVFLADVVSGTDVQLLAGQAAYVVADAVRITSSVLPS